MDSNLRPAPASFQAFSRVDNRQELSVYFARHRELFRAIISKRGVSNLNEQEHIVWTWMATGVVVGDRFKQHQVGLRLGVFVQIHRVLRRSHPAAARHFAEKTNQPINGSAMKRSDWRHINDLAIEQLDSSPRFEHSGFRHAIEIGDAEPMLCLDQHGYSLSITLGIATSVRVIHSVR